MTLQNIKLGRTNKSSDSSSMMTRPAAYSSPGVSDKDLANGYRSFLRHQYEQRTTPAEVVEQIMVLPNALATAVSNLEKLEENLPLADKIFEVIDSLKTIQKKISAGIPVHNLGIDLVKNVQSLLNLAYHATVEEPSKEKLGNAKDGVLAAIEAQTPEASRYELAQTIELLSCVSITIASPVLENAHALRDRLMLWVDQPLLSRAASTMREAIQHVEDLAKNLLDSSRCALIATVKEVQQKLAAAITIQQHKAADILASPVSELESYIEELTGMRPTFERWMQNFAHFRDLVTIQSAPDEEIRGHHDREQLERVNQLLKEKVDQLSPTELFQYAGLLKNRQGPISIAESLVIAEAVKVRCELSEHQMTLMNRIEGLVEQMSERIALERKMNTLKGDQADLEHLSTMTRVGRDKKDILVRCMQTYILDADAIKRLLITTLSAGEVIVPKAPVITGSLAIIQEELPRLKQMSAQLKAAMALTFQLAVESAGLCGVNAKDVTPLSRLKDTITTLYTSGYYGGRWGNAEHSRALMQLDQVGCALENVEASPASRTVPEQEEAQTIRATHPDVTPEPQPKPTDEFVASASGARVSDNLINSEATSSTEGQTTEKNPRTDEVAMYAEILAEDARNFGLEVSDLIDSALDPIRTHQVIVVVTKKLGQALQSPYFFGSENQGERIVCRILNHNLAALMTLTDEQIEAWASEVSTTLSMLRFAENLTDDRQVVEALSNNPSKQINSLLKGLLRFSTERPFDQQISRIAAYNRRLLDLLPLLWNDVVNCRDQASTMKILKKNLGVNLYSRLLPSSINMLERDLCSPRYQTQDEQAIEVTPARQKKTVMDETIIQIADQFHASTIPLFANKGSEFYRLVAFSIAYGWGKQADQSSVGVALDSFYENMTKKSFAKDEVKSLVTACTSLKLFIIHRKAGKINIRLNRDPSQVDVERFIYQLVQLRLNGGPVTS